MHIYDKVILLSDEAYQALKIKGKDESDVILSSSGKQQRGVIGVCW